MTSQQYVYVMKGLTKTYAGARPIVEDVWLSFYPGAKIGVLGLNGSGKSSLLSIMAGEDKEYEGEAWIVPMRTAANAVDQRSKIIDEVNALRDN